MGDLTKNLSRHEFACKDGCGRDVADFELVNAVQDVCDHFANRYGKVMVDVNSGNRCLDHNEKVQKEYNKNYTPFSSKSQHKEFKAGDFSFYYWNNGWETIPSIEVYTYLDEKYPNTYGLGIYINRVHLDTRKVKARWDSRTPEAS